MQGNQHDYHENWYEQKDPRECSYSLGYGFQTNSPLEEEKCAIIRYAYGLAAMAMLFFLMQSLAPNIMYKGLIWLFSAFLRDSMAREVGVQLATIIMAMVCLYIPLRFYRLYIGIPPKHAYPFRAVGFAETVSMVSIGMAVSVLSSFASMIMVALAEGIGIGGMGMEIAFPTSFAGKFLLMINLAVVPAIMEEIVFRGAIMQSLRRFGDGFALLCSAFVFAIVHGALIQIPNAFIMGLVLGYFTLYTGSLIPAMILHFCNNFSALMLSLSADAMPPMSSAMLVLGCYIIYLVIGLLGATYLLKNDTKAFGVATRRGYLSTAEKGRLMLSSPPCVLTILVALVVAISNMV